MRTNHNMTDYEKAYQEFDGTVPKHYNFVQEVIDKWAKDPEKLAMLWVDDTGQEIRKTFADLSRSSMQAANVLKDLGIKKGDKVLLVMSRQIAWWELFTACIRMGVVVIPSITILTLKDIEFRVNESKASCIVTNPDVAQRFDTIAAKCPTIKHRLVVDQPYSDWIFYDDAIKSAGTEYAGEKTLSSDPSLIYFTSSTEGDTKMAVHTNASAAFAHEVTGRYWLDLGPDDLHWNLSDTGWAKSAWSSYFGPWHMGAAIFVHHTIGFNSKKILNKLSNYPITTLCATPTIYRMLVLENLTTYNFKHLRHCVGAGEPMNPEIIEIWKNDTGCTIRDGYGQTETGLLAANFLCLEMRLGSMGKPVPGVELAIIDDNGDILPPNIEGTIAIKVEPLPPLSFFAGYGLEHAKDTYRYIGPWYMTTDRAYIDEDGYLWFVGRADDVILSSGYRIGPVEVEYTLMAHPAVFEAAVVSSPDDTRGQIAKAFVVLAEGFEPSDELINELQEHVKTLILPYKYPRMIQFVAELPKTFSGKIRRVDLRQLEWGQ